jgi:hypothetical protein
MPVRAAERRPRLDVATQRVEVPVVWRIIPNVPEALRPSRRARVTVRSVTVVVARVDVPLVREVPAMVTF